MRKRLFGLVLLILLLGMVVSTAYAQNYLFRVDSNVVNYFINKDGTASVQYTYQFSNDPGGSPIDFIDVIIPVGTFSLNGIQADVDGQAITDIQKSDYVDNGVAFGLGSNAIQPGQTGTVKIWIPVITKVIYPADAKTGKADYASIQFSPNHFDSKFVEGATDLTVTLLLPPGMTENDPIYYDPQNWPGNSQPESGITKDGLVYYTWQSQNANSYSQYTFGAGFPAKLVPAAAIVKAPAFNFQISQNFVCCSFFFLLFGGIAGLSIFSARRRKLSYLPPKISIEGHGIKRGLTAVEVAILMEQPMDKVMTMILFAVVKKNAARVVSRDPLKLEVAATQPEGLNPYEVDFLKAFKTDDPRARRKSLQDVMVGLVKGVTEKMRGFSRKETLAYYDSIMKQAWAQVEAANTPEVKSQKFDENMDWTMLDKNYGDRTRTVFGTGPVFVPMWWGRYDPGYHGGTAAPVSTSAPSGSSGGGGFSMPTLPGSDFAASMVNGVQAFSAGVIGDLTGFTGAVTNQTNPPPPPSTTTYRGGGGGGGHSCACACACAGCACACAGGGR